jgi:hypothetical protein
MGSLGHRGERFFARCQIVWRYRTDADAQGLAHGVSRHEQVWTLYGRCVSGVWLQNGSQGF